MFSKYLIIFPLALSLLVLIFRIDKPFIGHHDFMGAFIGKMALDFLRGGIADIKWTSYLPTLPILVSLSFKIFGVSEWAVRAVPSFFSILGVAYFYLVVQKIWNSQTALLGAFFYILTPMFIYFSKLPAPDPIVLSLMLAAFYYYILWTENFRKKYLIFTLIFFSWGALVGWTSGYFAIWLILHSLLIKKFKKELLLIPLTFILSLAMQLSYIKFITGKIVSEAVFSTLKFRLIESSLNFGGQDFNLTNYLKQELSWIQAYFTRLLSFLSIIYVLANLNFKLTLQRATIMILLMFGISHLILFSRYVFIHDFLNIYLLPFFALSGALGLNIILEWLNKLKINKLVQWSFIFLILLLFILERLDFTKALLDTKMNTAGLEMAAILNNLQKNDNEAVILSPRFESFYGVFTRFYSKNDYLVSTDEVVKKMNKSLSFKYIITIDEDISDKNFYNGLVGGYKHQRIDDLTIIYANEPN